MTFERGQRAPLISAEAGRLFPVHSLQRRPCNRVVGIVWRSRQFILAFGDGSFHDML